MKGLAIFTALLSLIFGIYTFAWQENTLSPSLDPIHESRQYAVDVLYMIYGLAYALWVLFFAINLVFKKPTQPARADVLDDL